MELKIGLKLLGGALASAVIASSSVYAWYPYSEKYTKWQADRPLTMTAWHNSVPRDRLDDRIARFKAAGLNQFYWLKPLNARHFSRPRTRQVWSGNAACAGEKTQFARR